MTLTIDPPRREVGKLFAIENASWELYELFLRDVENQNVRITYDQGRMVLMSPLPIHERIKSMAGRLVGFAAFEMDIPIATFGLTTWKRKDLAKGLEADECYYFENEPLVRGRTDIDLAKDPPPDLAIEIALTHNPLDRQSIYAALGVREIWQYDGEHFVFAFRSAAGSYDGIEKSVALSFMTPQVLENFVKKMVANENAGQRAFRDWLRTLGQ